MFTIFALLFLIALGVFCLWLLISLFIGKKVFTCFNDLFHPFRHGGRKAKKKKRIVIRKVDDIDG